MSAYDALPYPSFTFSQTHPNKLATMARLFGLTTAPVDGCRVLELGCGDGTNLLSFAAALLSSEFVGVDLSSAHIRAAQTTTRELGLSNIRFYELDILNVNRENFGEFDFIIAHGLYSWVPDFVRPRILEICREMLQPNGVGYISYNAFPGSYARLMTRGIMQFHAHDTIEPLEKVQSAYVLLKSLAETVEPNTYYQQILQSEYDGMAMRDPSNIYHDELNEFNQPFYFHEFIQAAEKHDLQYLAEADVAAMQTHNLTADIRQLIQSFGDDIIKREQYLDFARFRRFRQTLVCRREIELNRQLAPEILDIFFISGQLRIVSENPVIAERAPVKFVTPDNSTFEIDHPLTKAALVCLSQIWARSIGFDDLINHARQIIESSNQISDADFIAEKQRVKTFFLQIYTVGFIELHVHQFQFAMTISERPKVSDFARWQTPRGKIVTTPTGFNLPLDDDFKRALLPLLDGTLNKTQLLDRLAENAVENPEFNSADLPALLDQNLAEIAKVGLLVS